MELAGSYLLLFLLQLKGGSHMYHNLPFFLSFFFFNIHYFIRLHQVLVAACSLLVVYAYGLLVSAYGI